MFSFHNVKQNNYLKFLIKLVILVKNGGCAIFSGS